MYSRMDVLITRYLGGLMNRVIIFEIFLFVLVTAGVLFSSLGLDRAAYVFLTVGIIDILMSLAAWRRWPILRGDVSNNTPLTRRDSGEVARDEYSADHDQPSARFIVTTAVIGAVTVGVGVVLLQFFA